MVATAEDLRAVLAPVASAAGLDLEDVVVRPAGRRTLVRVVVDADGGVSLDAVAEVSGEVSAALDASGVMGESAYTLEVSSPGVDRPLATPTHWRRATGRLVEVSPHEGAVFTGRVVSCSEDGAVLEVAGAERAVAFRDIARALMQVEFGERGE